MMNDFYEQLKEDHLEPDPALTECVVNRWMTDRLRSQRRRRVFAAFGPIATAAVLVLGIMLVRSTLVERSQRAETSRSVALLISQTTWQTALQPQRIDDAIDRSARWLDPNHAVSLLLSDISSPFDSFSNLLADPQPQTEPAS